MWRFPADSGKQTDKNCKSKLWEYPYREWESNNRLDQRIGWSWGPKQRIE